MKRYINIKTQYGVETWESLNISDYNNLKEFRSEVKNIIKNYNLMGYNVYESQRESKN
jgi:hypothetical protein